MDKPSRPDALFPRRSLESMRQWLDARPSESPPTCPGFRQGFIQRVPGQAYDKTALVNLLIEHGMYPTSARAAVATAESGVTTPISVRADTDGPGLFLSGRGLGVLLHLRG